MVLQEILNRVCIFFLFDIIYVNFIIEALQSGFTIKELNLPQSLIDWQVAKIQQELTNRDVEQELSIEEAPHEEDVILLSPQPSSSSFPSSFSSLDSIFNLEKKKRKREE